MRKELAILLAIPLMVSLILAGCGEKEEQIQSGGSETQQQQEQQQEEQQAMYTGFMKVAKGQWVEYLYTINGKTSKQRVECVGIEEVDGKECIGFETDFEINEMKTILQMWIDKDTKERVKYVVKMNDQVYCIDPTSPNIDTEPPETETPDEYKPETLNFELGSYTVPGNGETITVAIFHGAGNAETWVSSEVPFGIVKVVNENGEEVMHLENFGLSGAHRDITAEERDNCTPLPFPI